MAGANLPAKKYTKKSPTVTRLSFEFDGGSTQFIDIAMALSAINRRFYRQGVYYYVNSVEIYNNETGVVDLHTLPDTWVTKNAWNRGFQYFQKMNSMTDMARPKYHDFKVYFNDLHRTTGSAVPAVYNINAAYNNTGVSSPDDWVYSQFTSMDSDGDLVIDPGTGHAVAINQEADNFTAHMIGGHVGTSNNWLSIGLIRSYADSRSRPQSSEPVQPPNADIDPLNNLFDASTEEAINDIIENLNTDNDSPPYNHDAYVGENAFGLHHVARIGTEIGVGRVGRASGFCAPLGLICVDPHGVSTAFRVVLNLAVGTYHGVYAERA